MRTGFDGAPCISLSDRDRKNTAKIGTEWIHAFKINVLKETPQSPYLSTLENRWCYHKINDGHERPNKMVK